MIGVSNFMIVVRQFREERKNIFLLTYTFIGYKLMTFLGFRDHLHYFKPFKEQWIVLQGLLPVLQLFSNPTSYSDSMSLPQQLSHMKTCSLASDG